MRPILTLGLAFTLGIASAAARASQQLMQGAEIEQFLRTARIVAMNNIGRGITLPRKATLELDGATGAAAFKTIDQKPAHPVSPDGILEPEFQDSWRTEVAAYELDKLIGLGMVPATVERVYEGTRGSLQFWVDAAMDEAARVKQNLRPPDKQAWANQTANLYLWDALIYNTDRQVSNLLVTRDWRLIAIDHSRSFRPFAQLKDARKLTRFSRSLLARLGTMTEPVLKERLSSYLTPFQISGLLKRRDAVQALAKKLVAQKGEAAVLFD